MMTVNSMCNKDLSQNTLVSGREDSVGVKRLPSTMGYGRSNRAWYVSEWVMMQYKQCGKENTKLLLEV